MKQNITLRHWTINWKEYQMEIAAEVKGGIAIHKRFDWDRSGNPIATNKRQWTITHLASQNCMFPPGSSWWFKNLDDARRCVDELLSIGVDWNVDHDQLQVIARDRPKLGQELRAIFTKHNAFRR